MVEFDILTSHLSDSHESMLRNRVRTLAGETNERVCRGKVDDDPSPNVASTISASPGLGFLLTHRGYLCTHTD